LFLSILLLRLRYGLPLHVARAIRTTRTERLDVVNDVAGTSAASLAGTRAWVLFHEGRTLMRIAGGLSLRNSGESEQQSQKE